MKLTLHSKICFMRRFRCIKTGFADHFAFRHYLRAPFSLVGANSKKSCFVGFGSFSNVLKVTRPRYLTKVAKSIVPLVAVYVVNVLRRPYARNVGPRQPMSELLAVVYGDRPVASGLFSARAFADKIRSLFVAFPGKNARVRDVRQRRPQMLYGARRYICHDNAFTIRAAA